MTTAQQMQVSHEPKDPQAAEYPALPYAGAGLRIVAGILDSIILASLGLLWLSAAGFYLLTRTDWGANSNYTNGEGWTAIAIAASWVLVVPLYFFLLWWWKGQSLGQMAVRIIVTDRDGYHMSVWQALLRTILTPISLIPFGVGLLPMFFDKESRALHDMIAGTVVLELP
jgi:uncharacterized RDD family membrane protein YckC